MRNNTSLILLLNFSTKWKCSSNIGIYIMGEYNDKCIIRKTFNIIIHIGDQRLAPKLLKNKNSETIVMICGPRN